MGEIWGKEGYTEERWRVEDSKANKGAKNRVSLNDRMRDNPKWTYHTRD